MHLWRYRFFIVLIFISQGVQAASSLQAPKSVDDDDWQMVSAKVRSQTLPVNYAGTAFPTLSSWSMACKKQPQNRKGAHFLHHSGFAILGSKYDQWEEFALVLLQWFEMMKNGSLSKEDLWQNSNIGKMPTGIFFDETKIGFFMPFVQKIIAEPQDEFYIRGDLHGDIYSLLIQLETMRDAGVLDDSFRILKDNVHIVFLGDYVDRGQYGCEVLYTMLRLSLANPDRVVFVRGNHEDVEISSSHGFKREVAAKFDDVAGTKHKMISRMNDFLPVVLYIGCNDTVSSYFVKSITNYLQCCHGGLEIGYDPRLFLDDHETLYQLIGRLNRASFVARFNKYCDKLAGYSGWALSFVKSMKHEEMKKWWSPKIPLNTNLEDNVLLKKPIDAGLLGFMWYDFDIHDKDQVSVSPSRGIVYGKMATEKILELQSSDSSKICGVFRGHQHGDPDMMTCLKRCKGVYKLWNSFETELAPNFRTIHDGKVWTFNVGPDSMYGQDFGFNFDAYARLIVDERLQDWKLQVFNTNVVT